jgi:glycosyltransferase involved in cell wall biosynthesis
MRIILTLARIERAGFTTYCENLSAGLNSAGHQVILLSGSTADNPAQRYAVPATYKRFVYVERSLSSAKSQIRRYIQVIADLKPDAMIINHSPFVMASLPFIPWHIIRIPVVHNTLGTEVNACLANHFWWDRSVCVSPLVARVARGLPGSSKLHVCPLGIPLDNGNQKVKRTGIKNGTICLIWVGRVERLQKRADLIPLIARELESRKVKYQWTVLGNGSHQRSTIKTITGMGIANKFRFMGSVPRRQVDEFYRGADVLVMPSDHEGLPQVLLESMSLGVVPVVSQIPGSTDYVVRNGIEGFLCVRGAPESFATKLAELANNPSLLDRMSKASIKRITKEFSVDSFADRILKHIIAVNEEGIVRTTPRPMKSLTYKTARQQGCEGLYSSTAKQVVKWMQLKYLKRLR